MKKRLLSCVLAGAMIVAMLAGCGGNSAEENAWLSHIAIMTIIRNKYDFFEY